MLKIIKEFRRLQKDVRNLNDKNLILQAQIDKPNKYVIGKKYKHGIYVGCKLNDGVDLSHNNFFVKRVHEFESNGENLYVNETILNKFNASFNSFFK